MAEIDKRVASKLAAAMKSAKGEGKAGAKRKKVEPPPVIPDFNGDFEDKVKGVTFSSVFKMDPPDGLPDLKAKIYKRADWTKQDQLVIPNKKAFAEYVPDVKVLYQLWVSVLRNNHKALVVGPTGSGKTTTQEFFCAYINQPYFRINGRGDMESDTILGKPWVSDGSMHYTMGMMVKAAQAGHWIAFDEPWKVPAPIQMALQRFYERNGVFQLDDMPGELGDSLVPTDQRCRVVLADNVVGTGDNMDQYASTMIQDGATLNRLDVVIYQPYMEAEKEVEMLMKHCPAIAEHVAQNMVKFITLCRTSYQQRAVTAAMSPRNLLAWGELAEQLRSIHKAIGWVVLDRFPEDNEKALINEHYRTVFDVSIGG